jgi:hypothetical protein
LEAGRFDELSRALAQASRRSLLRGLAAMAGAAVAACTPSRRPSKPSTPTERLGHAGPALQATNGRCDPEIVKSCMAVAYDRAGSRMSDCLARCEALPDAHAQERACASCFEWVDLMAQKDVRQCHVQTCGQGMLCMAAENDPLMFACCPPKSALFADAQSFACQPLTRCSAGGGIPLACAPPFVLDEEYCYCKCDEAALAVECAAGTSWDPEECRCA